jgi:hypothetical protein
MRNDHIEKPLAFAALPAIETFTHARLS